MTQHIGQDTRRRCLEIAKEEDTDLTLARMYEIKAKKNKLFPFKEITFDELEQLFIHEEKSVRVIAELFDVSVGQVNYKKSNLGIYLHDYTNEDYMRKIADAYENAIKAQEEFYKEREEKKASQIK